MNERTQMAWWNYRTEQFDYRNDIEDYSDYVPQIGGRGLYQLYVKHQDMKPAEAAIKVLSIAVGKDEQS